MTIYLGIDCGLDGATGILYPDERVEFFDTPTLDVQTRDRNRREYDVLAISAKLRAVSSTATLDGHQVRVAIERQQAMPDHLKPNEEGEPVRQGSQSIFRTGQGYGIWLGILGALGLSYDIVAPVSWKRAMMKDMGKEKAASIVRAKQLFPTAAHELTRKKDHNRADSILLAAYLRQRDRGNS